MPLTDTAIRQAKPQEKPYKLADSGGMYLEIAPAGGKWWRFKYRIDVALKSYLTRWCISHSLLSSSKRLYEIYFISAT
jgi:hypothetical protein